MNVYPQAVQHGIDDFRSVPTSPYVKDYTEDRKKALVHLVHQNVKGEVKLLKFNQSLCPGCVDEEKWDTMKIDCVVYVKDNKVWMIKQCAEHGVEKEVYWSDYEMFKKAEKFQDPGIRILNPNIDKSEFEINCPTDCGLCVEHESHTGLGNIVLTNICDLTCWYCLPYEEELPVKINGQVNIMKIGELVEAGMRKNSAEIDGLEGFFSVPESGMEVLTFEDGKASWAKVNKLLKRKYKGKFIKVKTSTGKKITTTADHRFAVISDKFQKKTAEEIAGENMLTISNIQSNDALEEIDFVDEFDYSISNDISKDTYTHHMESVFSALQESVKINNLFTEKNEPGVKINFLGDFALDSLAEIEVLEAEEQFVYDIEVESKSHTFIAGDGILISNCFFYAKEGEPVYEPTIDQIKFMLKRMRDEKPVGANAVQLTGGEPTLREDLPEIIKAATQEIGYEHVQLNTNGINLSRDLELCQKIKGAGSHVLYMSFDGVTPQTNPKNYWEAQGAIENCKKAELGVVLVPTVIGGVNDHELGDIIRFGMKNIGTVRAVNFQPVSLVGRMPDKLRRRQRITIPGAIKRIEEQTDGQIGREHWFPVPCAKQITDFIEAVKQEPKYRLSIHFACGMATYAFKDGEKMVALPEFFDIEGFFEYLAELTKEINNSKMRKVRVPWTLAKLAWNIRKYVDNDKKPKELKFVRMLTGAVQGGNYHGLADLHKNSLFIGMMHFQDPHNWDIDRIHKCDIHYASPDGRVLPFCTFNVIPALYRDKIQRKFSIPSEEWEKRTGKKIAGFKYHRKLTPEQMKEIKTVYDTCRRSMTKITPEADWGDEDAETIASQGAARLSGSAEGELVEFGASKFGAGASREIPKVNPMGGCGSCSTTPMSENGIINYEGPSESHEHGNGEGCCSSSPTEHKNGNGKKINIIQDDDHSEEGHGGCGSGGCGCGRSESGGGC